jgi:predicted nucleic acid-binding protein
VGSLAVPPAGNVYVDAQCVIYTVDNHPVYAPALAPLWLAVKTGPVRAVSSELTVMESLVGPYKAGDAAREADFETFFQLPGLLLAPVTQPTLRRAARLRAALTRLRTPDAIHAATAIELGVALFVTNDAGFRGVPGLPVAVLRDVLAGP